MPKTVTTEDNLFITSRSVTPEGFMLADATFARTGIQEYYATELFGADEMPAGMRAYDVVKLYRPADEVFHPDSVKSFEHQTITDDHPVKGVSSENWKQLAIGHAFDLKRVGDLMTGKAMIKDKASIEKIKAGKVEFSNGYTFEPDMTPGTTEAGVAYDGRQTNIRGNHIALVEKGRCGPACRIADQLTVIGDASMPRKITIDGLPYEVDDAAATAIDRLSQQRDQAVNGLTDLKNKISNIKIGDQKFSSVPDLIKHTRGLMEQNAALAKDHKTPEQIAQLVKDHAETLATAKSLNKDLVTDNKTVSDLRRETLVHITKDNDGVKAVVDAVLGGVALDKADDETLKKAFGAGAASVQARTVTGDNKLAASLLAPVKDGQKADDNGPKGRDAMVAGMTGAWMQPNNAQ